MTIEDAIKHCRDTALSNAGNAIAYLKGAQKMLAESCEKCAAEHEQLAKWLEELKQRRDAEPVRHGEWVMLCDGRYYCSECQAHIGRYREYCGKCGAKMDAADDQNGGAENG